MGFSPRKKARSEVPHIKAWPELDGAPRLQGFAGYKAGMTHAMIVDYRKTSTTANKLVRIPVTVVEVPPMMIFAVRFYENTPYGFKMLTEILTDELDPRLASRFPLPKKMSPVEHTFCYTEIASIVFGKFREALLRIDGVFQANRLPIFTSKDHP